MLKRAEINLVDYYYNYTIINLSNPFMKMTVKGITADQLKLFTMIAPVFRKYLSHHNQYLHQGVSSQFHESLRTIYNDFFYIQT